MAAMPMKHTDYFFRMEQIMYSKIVLCISEIEDEVLTKQLGMLSERHHADVERVDEGNSIERESKEKLEYSNDAEGGSEGSGVSRCGRGIYKRRYIKIY